MDQILLCEKKGCRLYGRVVTEGSTHRMSVVVYQISNNGNLSVPTSISRAEIMSESRSLHRLMDFSICLGESEFKKVVGKLKEMVKRIGVYPNIDERSTPVELYNAFCEYGKGKELKEIIVTDRIEIPQKVFLSNGGLNIQTTHFECVMQEIEETRGYKRIEILKSFKFMGVLETDKGRAYDKKVSVMDRKLNCYRIMLPDLIDGKQNVKENTEGSDTEISEKESKTEK